MSTVCVKYHLKEVGGSGYPPYWEDTGVVFEGGVFVNQGVYYGRLTATDPVSLIAEKVADWGMEQVDSIPAPGTPTTPTEARNLRITQVEAQSEVLFASGVTYDNTIFSLSSMAQSNWIALQVAVLSGGVSYPYDVSTIYGTVYAVQDADHMTAFLSAIFSRINTVKGPNGAVRLRNTIMSIYFDGQLTDAQKITNIMAVVDDRT